MDSHLILCSHNGERFIKEQITSILDQEEEIKFLHIFDFASSDQTLEILADLQAQYPQRRWNITRVDHAPGAAASFFHAIQKTAPLVQPRDCVFLADQDDVWLKNKTSVIKSIFLKEIKSAPKDRLLIFHDVAITDEKLCITQESFYTGNPYSVPRDLACDRLILCNPIIGHTMTLSGALLQLAAENLHGPNYLMHDWAIGLLASRTSRICYANTPALSLYRQHDNNVLGASRKRRLLSKIRRTHSFVQKVIIQAKEFSFLLTKVEKEINHPNKLDNWLIKITQKRNLSWAIYPTLGFMAFARGPTIQRKLLSAFIFLRWII